MKTSSPMIVETNRGLVVNIKLLGLSLILTEPNFVTTALQMALHLTG